MTQPAPRSPDIVVVGLGAFGSAVLYQLAKRGLRATGIDRFAPPHTLGSSHGESRITRQVSPSTGNSLGRSRRCRSAISEVASA